jgi:20S proteasome alpha/beta subunit
MLDTDQPLTALCSFHADPSGTMVRYDAKAIGSGSEGAQSELQDKYKKVRCSCGLSALVC